MLNGFNAGGSEDRNKHLKGGLIIGFGGLL